VQGLVSAPLLGLLAFAYVLHLGDDVPEHLASVAGRRHVEGFTRQCFVGAWLFQHAKSSFPVGYGPGTATVPPP
jgi:hypothetical protein